LGRLDHESWELKSLQFYWEWIWSARAYQFIDVWFSYRPAVL
jgi:hypothetical protein